MKIEVIVGKIRGLVIEVKRLPTKYSFLNI